MIFLFIQYDCYKKHHVKGTAFLQGPAENP